MLKERKKKNELHTVCLNENSLPATPSSIALINAVNPKPAGVFTL